MFKLLVILFIINKDCVYFNLASKSFSFLKLSNHELTSISTMAKSTRNATRCNNRNDLLHLSLTLKISILSEAYV